MSELVPLLLELHDGSRRHASVDDCEHATICEAFGLDPASTRLDLPGTMRDYVKLHAAFRSGRGHRRDRIWGFVFRGESTVIGRLHVLPSEGTRHRELYGWDEKANER
jgi:hypothetical protein